MKIASMGMLGGELRRKCGWILLLTLSASLLLSSMACRSKSDRPFEMGNFEIAEPGDPRLTTPPPRPEIKIIEPANQGVLRPGERVDCIAELLLPEHGKLPTFMTAVLRYKGQDLASFPLEPKAKDGDRYRFQGTIRAPKLQKRFKICVEASYLVQRRVDGSKADKTGGQGDVKTFHVRAVGPEFEVHR